MDFNTLLGQLETSRPDLADSLSLIRQFQRESKDSDTNTETESNRSEDLLSLVEKHKDINKRLLRQYHRLEGNYKLLIEQLDQLAEAIGACPQCWGDDMNCDYCHGRGKPGYFQVNQKYFDVYIKPVIVNLKKTNLKL